MTQLQKMHKLHRTKSAPSVSRVQSTPPPLPGPSILRTTCDNYDLPLPVRDEVGTSGGGSVSFAPLPETETFGRRGRHRLGVIARSDILNKQRHRRRERRSSTQEDFNDDQVYEHEQPYEQPQSLAQPPIPEQIHRVESGPGKEAELHAKMSKMSLTGESRRRSHDRPSQTISPNPQEFRNPPRNQISFKFWKRPSKAPVMSSAEERNEPAPQVGNRQPTPDHGDHVAPANQLSATLPVLSLRDPAGDQDSKDSSTPSTPKRSDFAEIALITYDSQGALVATVTDSRSAFPERKQHLDNYSLVQL